MVGVDLFGAGGGGGGGGFCPEEEPGATVGAGRESLEDSLGASEQVVHFQVPRHETCVAKLSWISEIRPLVYAASFPQGQQFHLEYQLAQYPILLVGDMLMWSEISSVQHLSEEFLHLQHHDHCQWRP